MSVFITEIRALYRSFDVPQSCTMIPISSIGIVLLQRYQYAAQNHAEFENTTQLFAAT